MEVWNFEPVAENIYRLRVPFGGVWTGITLVDGPRRSLIDSGGDAKGVDEFLIPALARRGLTLQDIHYLCCTHCHGDHVGGHARIRALCGAKIVCGRASAPKLRDPLYYSREIRAAFPQNSPPSPPALEGVVPDLVLEDGEELDGGLRLISSPGHDTDCVCWYDRESRTLITGDSLQGNGTLTQGTALYMDVELYRASLEKLSAIGAQAIVCGHAFTVTGDQALGEAAVKTYFARCREISHIYGDFIARQVSAGRADPVALAKGLIDFMGNRVPDYLFLPLYTVAAHLREFKQDNIQVQM